MTDIFEIHGDPNSWDISFTGACLRDAEEDDLLYDLSGTGKTSGWIKFVLEAIRERYNNER